MLNPKMNKRNYLFLLGIFFSFLFVILSLFLVVATGNFVRGFDSETGIVQDGGIVPLSYTGNVKCEHDYCSYGKEITTSSGHVIEAWTTLDDKSGARRMVSSLVGDVPIYTLNYALSIENWGVWRNASTPCINCTFFPGDYDGDGVSDLIGFSNEEKKGHFVLSSNWSNWYTFDVPACESSYTCNLIPISGDFDGDNKSDFVAYDFPSGQMGYLMSSEGYTVWRYINTPCKNCSIISGDYNGDKINDLVGYAPQACLPNCMNKVAHADDGCGGVCSVFPSIDYDGSKLYIYPVDNSASVVAWGCSGTAIGEGAQTDTNGSANTAAIVSGCSGASAARLCSDLSFGGYDDWYLPAIDQLSTMYTKWINGDGSFGDYAIEWANFTANQYWSSTERADISPEDIAWLVNFDEDNILYGAKYGSTKSSGGDVRCVRDDSNSASTDEEAVIPTEPTPVLYYALSPFTTGWNYIPMNFCINCTFFSGDYNGDGINDLLGFSNVEKKIYFALSPFDAGWSNFDISPDENSFLPISGNFDGDNISDLVAYNPLTGNISWWLSFPDWSILGKISTPCKNCTVISGDYEGDNLADLVLYNHAFVQWPISSPDVSINYPLNGGEYYSVTELNYTISGLNLQSCWYSTDNGGNNHTMSCQLRTVTGLNSVEGSNTWIVWANNTAGNVSSSSVTFFIITDHQDTTPPTIAFVSPTDDSSTLNRTLIRVNVTATDTNLKNITIRLYNSIESLIDSKISTTSPYYSELTGLTNGETYHFNAIACDTSNNCNSTETRTVIIDTSFVDITPPIITINSPLNQIYPTNSILLNITTNEDLTRADYSLDNGVTNVSLTGSGESWSRTVSFSEGSKNLIFYAVDSSGNLGTNTVSFTIDTSFVDITPPTIAFVSPTTNSGTINITSISVNVTALDSGSGLKNITIRLYNLTGLMNSAFTLTSPNFINFTNLGNGTYYFNATACDTSNNCANTDETRGVIINTSSPTIILDTIYPIINFVSPTDDSSTLNRTLIRVNVTATDTNLKNITINLYNSARSLIDSKISTTSPYYSELTGLTNGGVYYFNATACDTSNNCAKTVTKTVTINTSFVDTTPPSITLIYPENNKRQSGSGISFEYSVSDLSNIVLCRLSLRSNISMSDTNNWVVKSDEQSFTESLAVGDYKWNITCTDSFGNSATSETRTFIRTNGGCGDLVCDEDCASCSLDCGSCNNPDGYCGDDTCNNDETSSTCARDCGGVTYVGGFPIYTISSSELQNGYTRQVIANTIFKFRIGTGSEWYTVKLLSLTSSSAVIVVQGKGSPQVETLNIGGEKKFELTGDGYYDLSVKLGSITDNSNPNLRRASITLKLINEKVPATVTPVTCTPNWKCGWSECIGGMQDKQCSDANNCGKQDGRPIDEERECSSGWTQEQYLTLIGFLSGFIIILAGLISLVWWFIKRKGGEKKPSTIHETKPPFLLHETKTPPISNEGKIFVSNARKRGYSDSEIRKMFIKKGWKSSDIDRLLW